MSDESISLTPEQYERFQKLEKFLEDLNSAEKKVGVIINGPDANGFYRVATASGDIILPCSPNFNPTEPLKKDTEVMIIGDKVILDVVPEPLVKLQNNELNFKKITWDEIGGLSSQKNRIRRAVELPLKNKEIYSRFNTTPSKGVLLYGPPGVGNCLIY